MDARVVAKRAKVPLERGIVLSVLNTTGSSAVTISERLAEGRWRSRRPKENEPHTQRRDQPTLLFATRCVPVVLFVFRAKCADAQIPKRTTTTTQNHLR